MVVDPWVSPQRGSDFAVQVVWKPDEFIEVQCVDFDGIVQEKAMGFVRASNAPLPGVYGPCSMDSRGGSPLVVFITRKTSRPRFTVWH